ncbi:MAG TPA: hypothetical protein PLL30_16090 [Candidatus Krumholzibacteria bacterium]|nr:hypothetical protein [Candidatus Krumholzibacteria bacterium]HPD73291.1 hypothetical protein [Candidatus Krumholzibacteria bacterium]HRY42007.1 hypothetical protein [Candidatus Krumholzibacteria bacterium]
MSKIPEMFRLVDLSDPRTWNLVPISEWFHCRDRLQKLLPRGDEAKAQQEKRDAAIEKARKEFERLERRDKRDPELPWSGRQESRFYGLLAKYLPNDEYFLAQDFEWDIRFLNSTTWVDRIREYFDEKDPRNDIIRVLLEMLVANEPELEQARTQRRERMLRAVSTMSGKGFPGGKNPFVPDPIELLQLYRLACLVVIRLKEPISIGQDLGLSLDEYGTAHPCPKCGEKFHHASFAEDCCGVKYPEERREQHFNAMVVGDQRHRSNVHALLRLLWQFGYDTPRTPEDVIAWRDWRFIPCRSTASFARDLLGYLFCASAETIRRKISRGELQREYERYSIDDELRDFPDRNRIGGWVELRSKGWYRNQVTGRAPGPFEGKRIGIAQWYSSISYASPVIKQFFRGTESPPNEHQS